MEEKTLILYSHAACTLCDKLKDRIGPYMEKLGLTMTTVDIKQDRETLQAYRYRIPVINFKDQTILEGNPSDDEIRRAFEGFAG